MSPDFTSNRNRCATALAIGRVERPARKAELVGAAVALVPGIAAAAPVAGRATEAAVRRRAEMPLADAPRLEGDPASFLEKREPKWSGQ